MLAAIRICTGPFATGVCTEEQYQLDTCYNLTGEFVRNTVTFVPDNDKFYCLPYLTTCGGKCTSPTGCTLGPITHYMPSNDDLATVGGGWNQLIASFECHLGTPKPQEP
ncbi:hypothetical protein KVR01_008755 [Diaporthe batatas]|uniref:uncharacterized protein n=1 Tax=Diaporthe batatas TaxID=748121 RepID=UPI001D036D83|nr:uncharacterized protein KVR01_008755 [Diaporthe batatas]KAG8161768.1 hypothetical protein KVR01_008755 [Diaporthe batatas]